MMVYKYLLINVIFYRLIKTFTVRITQSITDQLFHNIRITNIEEEFNFDKENY